MTPSTGGEKGHRLLAATYDWLTRGGERRLLGKIRLGLVGAASGRILELGAGTGANFPYYEWDRVTSVVATEPDPYMLRRARERARRYGLPIELHQYPAEALPFPDASFDTVVATLVFCTVADPRRALTEIRRVLTPGGSFRFVEHVRAPGGLAASLQDLIDPVWTRLAAGCHLNRQTTATVEAAGFEVAMLAEHHLPLTPLQRLVVGRAIPLDR